jgi:hypothetical protein
MVRGSIVLATAHSDRNKPKGTGKDEPVIWVNSGMSLSCPLTRLLTADACTVE